MRQVNVMTFGKVGERLALGLFGVVLASYLIASYAGFTYSMIVHVSDTAVAALWHNGDLLLVEGSDFVQIAPHALTFVPWIEAELASAISKDTWVQWVHRWDATPGTHDLRVRATDASGVTQTGTVHRPAPDGATGHHTIRVDVR